MVSYSIIPELSVALPISAATTFQYPIEAAIESVLPLPGEIVVNVDTLVQDGTLELVKELKKKDSKIQILETKWNHLRGPQGVLELSEQANTAIDGCTNDWVLYLEADEGLHEKDFLFIKQIMEMASHQSLPITGITIPRLCFFGNLNTIRADWTIPIIRIFKKSRFKFNVDGNNPIPRDGGAITPTEILHQQTFYLYHYTRIGAPGVIGKRLKNLDSWFHSISDLPEEVPVYDFKTRDLDTYSISWNKEGKVNLIDASSVLVPFYDSHPRPFFERFKKYRD